MIPPARGESPSIQPGHNRSDHCAHHDGNEQNENNLVEPVEKPESKDDQNEHQGRPHHPPEGPIIRLRR